MTMEMDTDDGIGWNAGNVLYDARYEAINSLGMPLPT